MSDDPAYQFLDKNILVYAHDRSAGQKHAQAHTLVEELWQAGNGCLSVQVLQEFHVTVTQKVRQPLDMAAAARIIEDLAFWRLYTPDARDVLGAIDLQQRYTLSFLGRDDREKCGPTGVRGCLVGRFEHGPDV